MNWDLKALFKDVEELDLFLEDTKNSVKEFSLRYQSKVDTLSSDEFKVCIKEYESNLSKISKICTYAFLVFAKDTKNGSFYAKYDEECTKIHENLLFFEIEFNQLSESKVQENIRHCKDHGYYLSNLLEQKPHQLKLEQEQVLLRTSNTGAQAFSRLFDESFSMMKFKFKDSLLGEEEILSKLHSPSQEERKEAAQSLSDELKKHQHLLTYIYNMIKTDLKTNCELRGYKNAEEPRHKDNQTTQKSVDALIKASEANFDISSKFYKLKAKLLGVEKLYDYDRYAPLGQDSIKYEYERAKNIVLDAFGEFDEDFKKIAKEAFENGWIDVYPSDGKRGGAFSHSGSSDSHPYVLLNYTNDSRDLFTLAHELGHAIHQKLSYKVGYLNSDTPLTTAETASVFCEMLVFDYATKGMGKEQKAPMLAKKIEDIFATLFRQINFTTFERAVHAKDTEISSDELNSIWMQESKKMFGDSVILNEYYKIWWSYIPHFIHSPFYCYAYSYAQLLVLALFGLYKSGKCENFVKIYKEFLSSGGSKSPKELVGMFGFDIDDEKFWDIGLKQVRNLVDEFEELTC